MPGEHFGWWGGFQESQVKKINHHYSHSQRVIKVDPKRSVKVELWIKRDKAYRTGLPKGPITHHQHILSTNQPQTFINQTHATTSDPKYNSTIILTIIIRNLNLPKRRVQRLQAQRSASRSWHFLLSRGRQVCRWVEIKQDEWQGHAVLPQWLDCIWWQLEGWSAAWVWHVV